ncbi:hypothetical protein Goari_000703 [Gossypium aridum]|uniref:DUF4283 domain-containing protein n=1 Tax=Gossypium aridum TaxID=34290 RepID=A0A7J8YIC1_GOSAI|nr:hypothetical protein [Gossypium aridum]
MEEYISSFSLEEVEKDSIQLGVESVDNGISFANCFVRKFLTSSVVHFQAMRCTLANVWHPIGGVFISDLENDRFLFRFYFEVDVDRVERNGPWNFNSHLLVLHRLVQWENSLTLQITEVNFWILVNDIPYVVQLAYKGIMRLRVWLDVGSLLKRKKKLLLSNVSDSFDDEMVIREEENSPMHNLDGLKRPRTLSFSSGVSANKDSTEASDILLPRTLQRLRHMLRDSNPSVVFLIETKLKGSRLERIRCKCGYINGIDVDSNGRSGCLSMVVIGDFNEIAYMSEKRGGLVRHESQMRKFRDMLSDCVISNLRYTRQWFTWEKGHTTSNNIHERLDRAIVNDEWWSLFSNYEVSHLSHFFSDHCPLLLNSKVKSLSTKVHHFRFEAAWLLEDSCETMVKKLWEASLGTIPTRLHKVGEGLDKWFTQVKRERSMSRKNLERQLQRLNELTLSDKVLGDIVDTMLALSLEADKELYWEQRV